MDITPLTADELAEIHARPTRYFVTDDFGTLYRFAYNPAEFHGRFDPDLQSWVPDRAVEEFLHQGGAMTEITATQAAGLRTREQGLALLKRLATADRG